ncbi:hypothetical protein AC579_8642 [Pseudocercospora musae]|uniref:Uncharacterized protein n=1 Tax=Pseudocercospora musae TaxID=113226 RepID=A0A139IFJ4_9PEZI|nr:hypothetical protein AC579_8642 [Pseudocercospora musae]
MEQRFDSQNSSSKQEPISPDSALPDPATCFHPTINRNNLIPSQYPDTTPDNVASSSWYARTSSILRSLRQSLGHNLFSLREETWSRAFTGERLANNSHGARPDLGPGWRCVGNRDI